MPPSRPIGCCLWVVSVVNTVHAINCLLFLMSSLCNGWLWIRRVMHCLQLSYFITPERSVLGRFRHGHPLSAPCWKKFYLIGSLNASAVPLRHLWRSDPPSSASARAVLDCPHSQQFCSLAWVGCFGRAHMFDPPRGFLWKCTLNGNDLFLPIVVPKRGPVADAWCL